MLPTHVTNFMLMVRKLLYGALPLLLATVAPVSSFAQSDSTTTPIKHVVVIFDENITFDHYFATYPTATNPAGEPAFIPKHNTPSVNGLTGELAKGHLFHARAALRHSSMLRSVVQARGESRKVKKLVPVTALRNNSLLSARRSMNSS